MTRVAPVGGSLSRLHRFSVDTMRIDSQAQDSPLREQVPGRVLAEPREVQRVGAITAQIRIGLAPLVLPARVQQQDAALGDRTVLLFPSMNVVYA